MRFPPFLPSTTLPLTVTLFPDVHSLKTGVKNDLETKIKGNGGEFMQTIPPAETYEDRIIVAPEFTGAFSSVSFFPLIS